MLGINANIRMEAHRTANIFHRFQCQACSKRYNIILQLCFCVGQNYVLIWNIASYKGKIHYMNQHNEDQISEYSINCMTKKLFIQNHFEEQTGNLVLILQEFNVMILYYKMKRLYRKNYGCKILSFKCLKNVLKTYLILCIFCNRWNSK